MEHDFKYSPIISQNEYYKEFLQAGYQITLEAGIFAKKMHKGNFSIHHKDTIDLVTNIDLETEQKIISFIEKKFSGHSIISEEAGKIIKSSPFTWVIDPIDGTTNYVHHLPFWSVSIGLYKQDKPIAGWVFGPEMDQFFFGVHSCGSWLNNRPISVSTESNLSKSLLSTGFPYNIRKTHYTNLDL